MLDTAFGDRGEEYDGIGHPDHSDQQIDRPFEFGVFLTLRDTQRQRYGCEQDNHLPAPERECGEFVESQPDVAGTLHDVIGCREQRRTTECEYHRVGMQRPQAAVSQEWQVEIQCRPDELGCNDDADEHADDAPDHDHDRELAHNLVIIRSCCVQLRTPVWF